MNEATRRVQHTNYCRQVIQQYTEFKERVDPQGDVLDILDHIVQLARTSRKFLLPAGGRLYDDPQYKALDESEPLRLPFPSIALEYSRGRGAENDDIATRSTKAIVFARERDDGIVVMPVFWRDEHQKWLPLPEVALPTTGYLDRSQEVGGRVAIACRQIGGVAGMVPISDYEDEIGALMCFINVLSCQNVHIERSDPKHGTKTIKPALGFDSYHILTISPRESSGGGAISVGGRRGPREHLRRGHIRQLNSGSRIWINATVVAAGREAGKVSKDYALHDKRRS